MEKGITRLTADQINQTWAKKVRAVYEELGSFPDMDELIRFLKEPVYSITFRYALCRFLREKFRVGANPDGTVPVRYEDQGGTVFLHAFDAGPGSPKPDEAEDYIALMLMLAKDRGMEGQFQGKHLRKYLLGRQENVSRETLMKMAFAFDMDTSTVCELLESMDEIPYNFRDARECICFFCQYTQESNYWSVYEQMRSEWEKICAGSGEYAPARSKDPWNSSMMEDAVIDLSYEEEDLDQRMAKMLEYLREHRDYLYGYRQAAYRVLEELVEKLYDLTGAGDDTDLTIRLWSPIWVQFYTKKSERGGMNRSDFVPWKDLLDLPKTVYAKPLWRARLTKLRKKSVPVEKRDILFLNCMVWALSGDNEGGPDAMNEFLMETNDLLDRCGLSVIYPPNPYDRLILLAICSGSPVDVLSDLFTAATDEDKLEQELKKSAESKKQNSSNTPIYCS